MIQFFKGENEKYNVDSHGEGIFFTTDTNEIKVNAESYGKNADKSLTTDDIVVAGGPLANEVTDNWPSGWNKDGNKVIPAGISVQSILEGLFLKTVNGTVSWGTISWNPSLTAPTVQLLNTDKTDAGSIAEVGTTLIANTTTSSTVTNNKRSATCTASQGHFTSTDGDWVSGNKTVSVDGTSSGSISASYSWNGNAVDSFTSQSTSLKVLNGTNTFRMNQSGITAKVDALSETTVYASTNTKKVLTDVSAKLSDTASETNRTKALTSYKEDTITGSYKYFIGQVSGVGLTFTSDLVRGLSAKTGFVSQLTTADVLSSLSVSAGGNTYIIAVPEGYTITNILALGNDAKAAWTAEGEPKTTVSVVLPDNSTKTYNIFYLENQGGADSAFTNLKIGVKS